MNIIMYRVFKKVRRHYVNRHGKLNNVMIFAKFHKCDKESITKDLQHINDSLI